MTMNLSPEPLPMINKISNNFLSIMVIYTLKFHSARTPLPHNTPTIPRTPGQGQALHGPCLDYDQDDKKYPKMQETHLSSTTLNHLLDLNL